MLSYVQGYLLALDDLLLDMDNATTIQSVRSMVEQSREEALKTMDTVLALQVTDAELTAAWESAQSVLTGRKGHEHPG